MSCFSGSESTSTTETKTKEQKKGLKKALGVYLPQLGKGPEIFPESRVAPFSTLQEQAIAGAETFGDYFADPKDVGTPLLAETGTAVKGLLEGEIGAKPFGAQDIEDYFGRAIHDPNVRYLEEETIPGIAESFAGPGFFDAARSQEEVEARKDLGEWLGTQRAALEWDVLGLNKGLEEERAKRTQAAVPQAIQYGQEPAKEIMRNIEIAVSKLGGLGQIFGMGQKEQIQNQAKLMDDILKFAEGNLITDPVNLQALFTLLGMNFSSSTSTAAGPGLAYAGITSFLGGFGGGLGQGMATPATPATPSGNPYFL